MNEIYILPVADHLNEEEVNFELRLRKQSVDKRESLDDKRRFLRRLFSEDRKSQTTYQGTHNIQDQLSIIETNVNDIIEALRKKVDRALFSRLRHYLIRASSASVKDKEDIKLKKKICGKIEHLLQEFKQEIKGGPPKSDEDESNSAKEEKELSLSWRNPDSLMLTKTDKNLNETQSKSNTEMDETKDIERKGDTQAEADQKADASRVQKSMQGLTLDEVGATGGTKYTENPGCLKKTEKIREEVIDSKKRNEQWLNYTELNEQKTIARDNRDSRIQHGDDGKQISRKFNQRQDNYPWDCRSDQRKSNQIRTDHCDNYRPRDNDRRRDDGRRREDDRKRDDCGRREYDRKCDGGRGRVDDRERDDDRGHDNDRRDDDYRRYESWRRRDERYSSESTKDERSRYHHSRDRGHQDSTRHRRRRSRSAVSYDSEYDSDGSRRECRRNRSRQDRSHGRRHRRRSSSEGRSPERFRNSYRKSRVENWDLSFSGDSKSVQVEDFLNRIKKLAHHEGVSDRELLRNIHHRLKGEAYDWWFTREDRFTRWEKFEDEIRFRYGNPNRDRGIRAQIRELKQRKGETFIAYVTEVEKLNQCLQRSFSSDTLFELIWENMRPHDRSRLSVLDVDDLEHLIKLNHRIDANDQNFYKPLHGTRGELHHIEADESFSDYSEEDEIPIQVVQKKQRDVRKEPIRQQQQPTQRPQQQQQPSQRIQQQGNENNNLCWNCQKPGHAWRACTERKLIFCYACGKLGRTTRTCENNHPQTSQNAPQSTN